MRYIVALLVLISRIYAYNYHGCALASDNLNGWVVCLDTSLIIHTSDGGVTWTPQNLPDTSWRVVSDVTCVGQSKAWTCGEYTYPDGSSTGEILHTDDCGLNWSSQARGTSKYEHRIEFLDENYGWVACSDGTIGRTVNGGQGGAWEQIYTGSWYAAEVYGVSFFNPVDGWAVAGFPDSMLTEQGYIFHSPDSGKTWDSLYQSTGYEDFLDVYFFNLLDGIVVGGDDQTQTPIIWKTSDGGMSWDTITAPANAYYLRAVDFVDNEGWAVGKHGTIIHSSDYGNTWTFQPNAAESTLFDVDFADGQHGLACGYNIVLFTTDGGQDWLPTGVQDVQVRESQNAENLSVYPNPCKHRIDIKYSIGYSGNGAELKIYNVTGRLVKNFKLPTAYSLLSTTISWDDSDDLGRKLPEGIYFVRFQTENYQKTEKIVFLR